MYVPLVFHKLTHHPASFEDVTPDLFNQITDAVLRFDELEKLSKNDDTMDASIDICITFDDGNESDLSFALPILLEKKLKAHFFIVTDWIDRPGYLSAGQIRDLNQAGMSIGSHSKTHKKLGSLSEPEQMNELKDSKSILEEIIQKEVSSLSFPFGSFNSRSIDVANSLGYSTYFCSKHGMTTDLRGLVPRNSINRATSIKKLARILRPNYLTHFSWFFEDFLKASVKTVLGDKPYIWLRNNLKS